MAALRSGLPSRLRRLLSGEGAIGPSLKADSEPVIIPPEAFVPLTQEEDNEIARALSPSFRRRVLVTHRNSNIETTGEMLQCLRPGAWLNDEVINVYLELLKERENREPKKFLRCHFFNTFFYKKDRLEGANAPRKQMWADVQLDKRRLKEEYLSKFTPIGGKAETEVTSFAAPEGIKSPLPVFGIKDETSLYEITNQKLHIAPDISTGQDNFPSEQQNCAAERSLAQLKSYITHKAEEMSVYRSLPLGQDRRRNRYWQFVASASRTDPGAGRIFIELHDGHWAEVSFLSSLGVKVSNCTAAAMRMLGFAPKKKMLDARVCAPLGTNGAHQIIK